MEVLQAFAKPNHRQSNQTKTESNHAEQARALRESLGVKKPTTSEIEAQRDEAQKKLNEAQARGEKASFIKLQERALQSLEKLLSAESSDTSAESEKSATTKVFYIGNNDVKLKDDMMSMEHSFFALKAGDTSIRKYERNGISITIKPGPDGCATIDDKDLWIYCISHIIDSKNNNVDNISRTVNFIAHDFFKTTKRDDSGDAYKRLPSMFERLSGTRIETNIETDGVRERGWFGLIESARIVQKDGKDRMAAVEVTLPHWLWRSLNNPKNFLTIDAEYFLITKPLYRRVYEIARKHCGNQSKWRCSLETLFAKSGSRDVIRNFRSEIKQLAKSDVLPGYHLQFENDLATFTKRLSKALAA